MRSIHVLAVCLVLACAAASRANAFGAIALGMTEDGITAGFAMGTSWGYPTQNQASLKALAECRAYDKNPSAARRCKILDTFHDQCFATAMDPEPGNAGLGLAIANEVGAAEERALSDCKNAAGDRAEFCEVSDSNCDGQ